MYLLRVTQPGSRRKDLFLGPPLLFFPLLPREALLHLPGKQKVKKSCKLSLFYGKGLFHGTITLAQEASSSHSEVFEEG